MDLSVLDYSELLTSFLGGVSSTVGRGFAGSFIRWALRRNPDSTAPVEGQARIVRQLSQDEIRDYKTSGLPAGHHVCRYSLNKWCQTFEDGFVLPDDVKGNDTYWLIPNGPKILNANLKVDDSDLLADYGIEYDPFDGLDSLILNHNDLTWDKIGLIVTETLSAAICTIGANSALTNKTDQCLNALNTELKPYGLKCKAIRFAAGQNTENLPHDNAHNLIVSEIQKVKTKAQWKELVESIEAAAPGFKTTAQSELDALQEQAISGIVSPDLIAERLAETAKAVLTKSGITLPDLERWQKLETFLHEADQPVASSEKLIGSTMEVSKKPSTWFTWNREELDRKLMSYIKNSLERCTVACRQALRLNQSAGLSSLRQIKDLSSEILVINELLATTPLLFPKSSGLQLKSSQVKEALRSLESAVLKSHELSVLISNLFRQTPGSQNWNNEMSDCFTCISSLTQFVQSRRQIRL